MLFVGLAQSSHTRSWLEMLHGARLNVRLFGMPSGTPPAALRVPTYVTADHRQQSLHADRRFLYPRTGLGRLATRAYATANYGGTRRMAQRWLADVVRAWEPDVIHTFGVWDGSSFYEEARARYGLEGIGRWVVQVRGGADVELDSSSPEKMERLVHILGSADRVMVDSDVNAEFVKRSARGRLAESGVVPGSGGVDVDAIAALGRQPASERASILWPKAYRSPWASPMAVLEGLRQVWSRVGPVRVDALAACGELRAWVDELPEDERRNIVLHDLIPRTQVLKLMGSARVMLAPSLVDGRPNVLFEAMAAGAFPIVSPLEPITAVVSQPENVLFARNLYPYEIADAITQAMRDDDLVDRAAIRNAGRVRELADCDDVRRRVVSFYELTAAHDVLRDFDASRLN